MTAILRLVPGGHPIDDPAAALDVLETKLMPPARRPAVVPRTAQVERLRASLESPVVAIIAPAGYGKSTLAASWAQHDGRPFAWYSADARDSDPAVLVRGLGATIARTVGLEPEVLEVIAQPGPSIWTRAMPRLGSAVARRPPFVLVVDDMDRIADHEAVDAIVTLAGHLPMGSQVALVARSQGLLPLARLVSRGELFVMGRDELALGHEEVTTVARLVGARLTPSEVDDLVRRTEGWPTGVYLSLLAARDDRPVHPTGGDAMIEDYLRTELLDALPPGDVEFVLRTSVLERLSGPLCDAVLDREDSAAVLDRLERTNLFLVPLDDRRTWYRYHHLLTELLPAELERRHPGMRRQLLARAVAWHQAQGLDEAALELAIAADDAEAAGRLFPIVGQRALNTGRIATLHRWLAFFDRDGIRERHPVTAALASTLLALDGDAAAAERWIRVAFAAELPDGPDGAIANAMRHYGRSILCVTGPEDMRRDAALALEVLPESHPYRVGAVGASAIAQMLLGDPDAADAALREMLALYDRYGRAHTSAVLGLIHRAWLAEMRGDWTAAEGFARQARRIVVEAQLSEQVPGCVVAAFSARIALRHGATAQARTDLREAQRLRPLLTHAMPWLAVATRIDIIRCALAMADAGAARTMLGEIRQILEWRPQLGRLLDEVAAVEERVRTLPASAPGVTSLTVAELRLLPLLTTHLSFVEIGQRLYLSRNTVKSQAKSLYRKLDAESRSQAVEIAVQRGLLDAVPAAQASG